VIYDHENTTNIKLYLADTLAKMMEGYKNKSAYDFENRNALGMLFLLYKYYSGSVCITMKNVSLNITVFIADLNMKINKDVYVIPLPVATGKSVMAVPIFRKEYYVTNASISIVQELDLKPGDEICISLKNIAKPIMIEIDPHYADVFRKADKIEIMREDAEKIAFK
jgi:uncharacterized membrane protein (UPF0127 family)